MAVSILFRVVILTVSILFRVVILTVSILLGAVILTVSVLLRVVILIVSILLSIVISIVFVLLRIGALLPILGVAALLIIVFVRSLHRRAGRRPRRGSRIVSARARNLTRSAQVTRRLSP